MRAQVCRLPGAHLTLEDGIVPEALGGGHVPAAMLGATDVAAAAVPVVLASLMQAGEVLQARYGFPSSERTCASAACSAPAG